MEKDTQDPETQDDKTDAATTKAKAIKKVAKKDKNKEQTVNNTIEINPQMNDSLKEAKADTVVLGWGRMNPITTGHEKLAKKVAQVATQANGVPKIYLSHSTDPKKNPLSYNDKVSLAQKAFGNIIIKSQAKTIIQVMQELQRSHKNVVLVVGSDRVSQFETLLNKYNGKDYSFDSIKIVSAGERDPDADDVSGMSASKMRALAADGEEKQFIQGLPQRLKRDGKQIFNMVRTGMKLAEELEAQGLLDEAVLTYAQRRKRALVMRKYKNRIKIARQKSMRKAATMDKLKSRARKKAINIIRAKVAGKKGMNYAQLSPGEKMLIDKRVAKKKAVIDRIAKRMIPQVRKLDLQRLADKGKVKKEEYNLNEEFEWMYDYRIDEVVQDKDIEDREGTQPAKYHKGLAKSTKAKRDAQFKKQADMDDDNPDAYRPAPGDAEAKTKTSTHTKRYHQMFSKEGQLKFDGRFRAFRQKVSEESELQKVRDDHKSDRDNMKRRHKDEILDAKRRDLQRQSTQEEFESDEEIMEAIVELALELDEAKSNDALQNKAEKSGMPLSVLKKVFDRGVAAWRTGHRPGTTPQQWGFARVNSFVTKSKGTWGKADADLASKVKSEDINEGDEVYIVRKGKFQRRVDGATADRMKKDGWSIVARDHVREETLEEGINDPGIFKAVFLAGGPGSGKSFIVGKTALTALGLKLINSDDAFEAQLKKAGLKPSPDDIFSPKGQELRGRAKALTGIKQKLAINGRLGLVVDGTGKDYAKIVKQAAALRGMGYETAMIFVNTDLETAQKRNSERERTLPEKEVETMWHNVQNNIGKFQNFFGRQMYIVDNSEGANWEGATNSVYKRIGEWTKTPPKNPTANKWINDAKRQRGIKEDLNANFEVIYEESIEEQNWAKKSLAKVVFKGKYKKAAEKLKQILQDKQKEAKDKGHKGLRHSTEYYAAELIRSVGDRSLDARELAKMVTEEDPCWDNYKQVGMKKKNGKEVPNCVPESVEQADAYCSDKCCGSDVKREDCKCPPDCKHCNCNAELKEKYGDMDRGTDSLTKKYVKDTPYQVLPNGVKKQADGTYTAEELISFKDSLNEDVSQQQIKDLEVFADRLLNKFDVDIEFTKHFADRMNDKRNDPGIKISELQQLFKKIAKSKAKGLKSSPNAEVVLKDIQKDLNLPVAINYKRDRDEFEVVNKTIMRKKNFSTSNKTIKY